jgi:hypothetical protein
MHDDSGDEGELYHDTRSAMRFPPPALATTLHALYGDPDVRVVAPALCNQNDARILALVPNVAPPPPPSLARSVRW